MLSDLAMNRKTWINYLEEPLYLTLGVPAAAALRLGAGRAANPVPISLFINFLLIA
jgi:hypothetical protein